MIKIKGDRVIATELPKGGYLKSGKAVSGYNRLPEEVLVEEGWIEPQIELPTLKPDEVYGDVIYKKEKGNWVETREVKTKDSVIDDIIAER